MANSVETDDIKADYQNGVLTLSLPKREEAKPKQIKVNVGTQAVGNARNGGGSWLSLRELQTRSIWAGGRTKSDLPSLFGF